MTKLTQLYHTIDAYGDRRWPWFKRHYLKIAAAVLVIIFVFALASCAPPESVQDVYGDNAGHWTKWGEAKITTDMWQGTAMWQFRTNLDTGMVQGHCQILSEKGGYK